MNPANAVYRRLNELLESGKPLVVVTVTATHGSVPNKVGHKMIVSTEGLCAGSVGGGRVEAKAIDEAREMLGAGTLCQSTDWSLKADVGMTCGGRVTLFYESLNLATWKIVIFGAGHVTQALILALAKINCDVTCIDPRNDWLSRLPAGVRTIEADEPSSLVETLADDSFVLCMTRGHRSDFPVLLKIFQSGRQFPFLGVIGSNAKAAVLRKELEAAGITPDTAPFHCPVGLPIGSNDPAEIAISIAAQLLEQRDQLEARNALE